MLFLIVVWKSIATPTTLRRTSVFQPLMQRLQFNNLEDASEELNPGWAAADLS